MSQTQKPSSKRSKLGFLLIGFGIVGFIFAGYLLNNNQKLPKAPSGAITSKAAPSSIKPAVQAVTNYSVPAYNPKYLSIPAIAISKTRIIQLDLNKDNQIAVPDNIYDTGWYSGSAKPGQSGAMFIYGHVSSWTAKGVFYNLKKLKPGDTITITRGDNGNYTYRVIETAIYPYNAVPMSKVLAPINADKPGLNLMTCTGQVIAGTSEFSERLVVFASADELGTAH